MAQTPAGTGPQTAGQLERVERAVAGFSRGQFVIVFDDESRENEGDLMVAAEHTDHKAMAYMLAHTAGVVCAAVPFDRCAELDLPQMVSGNSGLHGTAFTVSVDLRHGATTGIPAPERARTIRALADPSSRPGDLARPGHVFPIRAARGGVLERDGHTEAAVDLSRLAGLSGVTAICEVVLPDGSMARYHDLKELADREGLALISVGDLIAYRMFSDAQLPDAGTAPGGGTEACMKHIGVADTMFARIDMGSIAEKHLQGLSGYGKTFTIRRRTVPGFKDLALAAKLLIEQDKCQVVIACGMSGGAAIDAACAHEASQGIMMAQLLTGVHVLEVFVHTGEEQEPEAFARLCENRVRGHAQNAYWILVKPEELRARAGKGIRQGARDAGPLVASDLSEHLAV